jgi:hypothetical protein
VSEADLPGHLSPEGAAKKDSRARHPSAGGQEVSTISSSPMRWTCCTAK